jgi:hypothetical protein
MRQSKGVSVIMEDLIDQTVYTSYATPRLPEALQPPTKPVSPRFTFLLTENDRAKDLGIINIANTLPQSLAPIVAALFITQFHSYPLLFTASALITLLGGILIQPIKSVR